jgi:hypothetical protein
MLENVQLRYISTKLLINGGILHVINLAKSMSSYLKLLFETQKVKIASFRY